MKCVIVIACGLADEPHADLGGRTPLEAARTPHLDAMAARGILGLTRTTPRGTPPGCNVGALTLLGYEPALHQMGAAALEALGVGRTLAPADVALRASLVTLDVTEDGTEVLGDALGGRLPAADAATIARDLASALGGGELEVVPGAGHRHVLVWHDGDPEVRTVSPYELVDKPIADVRPSGRRSEVLRALMDRSREILEAHPIAAARRTRAERVPTVLWPWAPSQAASLPSLHDAFGVEGGLVAGVPLARGLGIAAGLEVRDVPGATGDLDSDFAAKVDATIGLLETRDLAVLHVAAADAAAHAGDAARKVQAIERLDELVVGPLLERLRALGGDWRLCVVADHPTACATRQHTAEPVPFVVSTNRDDAKPHAQKRACGEKDAREQGIFIQQGHTLLERLLRH
jgi:2,3-bisphosphoglycerate-independent phosphoglycerate mutase